MLPVRPRMTVQVGVLVMRSKLRIADRGCMNLARLVQFIVGLAR